MLDPDRMRPRLPLRGEDELGVQAEMALPAIHEALAQAGRSPADVDAVIVGCSNLQRAYPAVSIEIQDALGASGWAYDMNVACSSATFAMQAGVDALRCGSASCVVVFAFMAFLLAYTPCVATLAAQKREVGWRWAVFGVGMQLVVAWLLAVAIFTVGRLIW